MIEVWKDVPGYENIYQASNLGRVKSLDRFDARNHRIKGRLMVQTRNKLGYKRISFSKNGKLKKVIVHRIIAITFLGEHPELDVNHIDGNPSNNVLSNLEWCTRAENLRHAYDVLGRPGVNKGKFNEKNKRSKPINMYSIDGEFIRTFPCSLEASRVMNIQQSDISRAANGKRNHAGGYKWKYKRNERSK